MYTIFWADKNPVGLFKMAIFGRLQHACGNCAGRPRQVFPTYYKTGKLVDRLLDCDMPMRDDVFFWLQKGTYGP